MSYRSTLPRLLGLSVVTGVGLLAQEGTANATVATDLAMKSGKVAANVEIPGDHVEYLAKKYAAPAPAPKVEAPKTEAPKTEAPVVDTTPVAAASVAAPSCNGPSAIASATYKVDGKTVSGLRDNVEAGDKVEVNFKLVDGCDDTSVGLAAYQAPSDRWDPATASQQKLVDHEVGSYESGKTHSLEVTAPSCYFQVDFFTGPVLKTLTATANYNLPNGNLIDADNGGSKSCDVPPPTTTPPTTTPPTTTPPVVKDECPTDSNARVVSYSWTINGVPGFKTLDGNAKPGDHVEVVFTIAKGCDDVELSLASYDAPSSSFTRESADEQVLFDSETGKFDAGTHTLDVEVPDCYFQVDFVRGGVLTTLGPENTNNYYGDQGRLIEADNGGEECVVETPPVEVEVLEETITRPQLAETGVDSSSLALLGSGLTLMGAALERAASRIRRRNG